MVKGHYLFSIFKFRFSRIVGSGGFGRYRPPYTQPAVKACSKLAYFAFSTLGPPSGVPDMPKKCGMVIQVHVLEQKLLLLNQPLASKRYTRLFLQPSCFRNGATAINSSTPFPSYICRSLFVQLGLFPYCPFFGPLSHGSQQRDFVVLRDHSKLLMSTTPQQGT